MEHHHKSKKVMKHFKYSKSLHQKEGELTRTLNQTDADLISQNIRNIHNLLDIYQDNISFLEDNKGDIIDRMYFEIEISNKLNTIKSKAETVYLFTMDYMNNNLTDMTRELGILISESEDFIEAQQKTNFVYYIPFLNTYLYEKEKSELAEEINHIENFYVNNIKKILKLHEEVKKMITELDRYYDVAYEQ